MDVSPTATTVSDTFSTKGKIAFCASGYKIGAEMIRNTIRELPEEYATYLYLSTELELSPENIADILQVKPSSLRMIAYRARKMLREACESKGLEVGNRGKQK